MEHGERRLTEQELWQDAMTSEQVMLPVMALLVCGCVQRTDDAPRMPAMPGERQVWAVAPLRNESGSLHADGLILADHLARQLETAPGVDVLPVNRTLAAMRAMRMPAPTSRKDALKLLYTLGVDALVVGTISAYDPYDPPKLGLALELYVSRQRSGQPDVDVRELVSAPVDGGEVSRREVRRQPVCVVSAVFDASDSEVERTLNEYATSRSRPDDTAAPRLHRISMDLFSKFVSHVMSLRLLEAESRRLAELTEAHVPDR